jgi:putative ABC transport system permease protein
MSGSDDRHSDGATGAPKRAFQLPASPARLDAELEEELRFHVEERREQLIAEGMSDAEADAEVRRRFGDYDSYRKETRRIDVDGLREQRRAEFFTTLWRETQRSARVLLRQRSFSILAFLTLAIGLGATTAMYAVLDTVVLQPLPYAEAGQLVSILHPATVPGSGESRWGVSPGGYFHFRDQAKTVSNVGIYRNFSMAVTNDDLAELAQFAYITHGIFDAFRARAELGRLIDAGDDRPGAPQVAVLSHEFHQRRFGGDPGVLGTTLQTTIGPFEIVGVTAPGLTLPMPGPFADATDFSGFGVDVWIAQQLNAAGPFWNNHPNVGIARLKDGVRLEDANRELAGILARFPETMPRAYSPGFLKTYNFRVEVSALRDAVLGTTVPRTLWMLFAAVLLVLGIATANVGNLFLVRMEARRQESVLRAALGADRTHMAAHFLSESLLLCGAAAVGGLALAALALRLLVIVAPTNIPRLSHVSLGAGAIVVGLGTGLLIGLVLGLMPLLRRSLDIGTLRDGGRGLSASPRQRVVRSGLVAGQLALTVVLLAAAGLMLRSFTELRRVQPGFDAANTLAFDLSLPANEVNTREKAHAFHQELQQRLGALPGVIAVGAGSLPLRDQTFATGCSVVFRERAPYGPDEQTPCVATPTAIPGYFEALGIEVSGHMPSWVDVAGRTQAVVVTRALADRLWPGEDPIGKGINSNGAMHTAWYRVTGVVGELRAKGLDQPPTEAVFYAATSLDTVGARSAALNDLTILVRTDGADPLALVPAARAIVTEMNARAPFISPRTMEQVVSESMARTTFILWLLGIAAFVALLLSAVGTYGVVSYLVTQRRVEIGIRMALGASASQVVQMVVLQTARIAVVGLVLGVSASLAGTRTMRSLLFGIGPGDPAVVVAAALLLLVVVTTASFAPARRAARIEPVEAMRGA